jgi:hypothetical protein
MVGSALWRLAADGVSVRARRATREDVIEPDLLAVVWSRLPGYTDSHPRDLQRALADPMNSHSTFSVSLARFVLAF